MPAKHIKPKMRATCHPREQIADRWMMFGSEMQARTSFLSREVEAGQQRMWEIKGRIKAAYKYDKPEFHRVSVGERRGSSFKAFDPVHRE